jgi:hypothetical protein
MIRFKENATATYINRREGQPIGLIPTMRVDNVLEDEVRLSVSEKFIERLPEYKQD